MASVNRILIVMHYHTFTGNAQSLKRLLCHVPGFYGQHRVCALTQSPAICHLTSMSDDRHQIRFPVTISIADLCEVGV